MPAAARSLPTAATYDPVEHRRRSDIPCAGRGIGSGARTLAPAGHRTAWPSRWPDGRQKKKTLDLA